MLANEHITIRSNSYENVKTFKYLGSLLANQNSIHKKHNVDLKQKIHVVIQSNTFVFLTFLEETEN